MGQHPDVLFSTPKEPLFFEAEYEKGLDYYWRRYFAEWSGQLAVGEARPYNLFLPFVPERIRESLGDARLIAILRNPIDRAYSHWWMRYSHSQERLGFEDALEANQRRLERGVRFDGAEGPAQWLEGLRPATGGTRYGLYLDPGYYADQLERYLALFPAAQLEVVLYEDLQRDPEALTRRLWRFVGVNPDAELRDRRPQNPARQEMQRRSAWYLRRLDRRLGLAPRLPAGVKDLVRRALRGRPAVRPPMRPETHDCLARHFAPHNRRLEALLGRDLSAWARAGSDGDEDA
jgi:hypothetical protein